MTDHSLLDRRSLAFHVAIAEKLRLDRGLLERVSVRLNRILSDERISISTRDAYRERQEVIEKHGFDELLDLLVDPGEEATRLRQATPFSDILSIEERKATARQGRPSKNIPVTRGKVELHVASRSNRILFDRQPLIHVEPKSPVGSHVSVDKRRQCT
jgi:hypothetical protein